MMPQTKHVGAEVSKVARIVRARYAFENRTRKGLDFASGFACRSFQTLGATDLRRMLRAMGAETANLHLGTQGVKDAILMDLDVRAAAFPPYVSQNEQFELGSAGMMH